MFQRKISIFVKKIKYFLIYKVFLTKKYLAVKDQLIKFEIIQTYV